MFGTGSTFTVSTTADELDLDWSPGDLSLREAIGLATEYGSGAIVNFDTALFSTPKTIMLTLGQLLVRSEMSIEGAGSELLTINAGHGTDGMPDTGDGFRVFRIENTLVRIEVTVHGVTITGGDVPGVGGGVASFEDVTLENVTITQNADTSGGGGVYHQTGDLIVHNSAINDNRGTNGGGIYIAGGTAVIEDSTISHNSTTGSGGGIHHQAGGLTLQDVTVAGNSSSLPGGGGISISSGTVDVYDSQIIENRTINGIDGASATSTTPPTNGGSTGNGGGIFNAGTLNIVRSVVTGNRTGDGGDGGDGNSAFYPADGGNAGHGGGIYNTGTLSLESSRVALNRTGSGGDRGVYFLYLEYGDFGRPGYGGGIDNRGTVTITTSLITDNRTNAPGGGISSVDGIANLRSSTVSGNIAVGYIGAGLSIKNGSLDAKSSTISGNLGFEGINLAGTANAVISHSTISDHANAIRVASGSSLTIDHTIVAGNTRDIIGQVTATYSLIGNNTNTTIINQGGNQIGTAANPIDPILAPLAFAGGVTMAHALISDKPGN